ncbi:MAG: single-stranded DNA-binding protein [Sphaerochaetaceae bacterium]|nr:single-stranded DNA-binding protein [Sphaerochaetaceae bacterium]
MDKSNGFTKELLEITKKFSTDVDSLSFSFGGYVYNPLSYGWDAHVSYLEKYVFKGAKTLFLGMNPGPFGMMQTSVPFGEILATKNYLHLDGNVSKPLKEHPNRPVLGYSCTRSEISGKRLWGLFEERYPKALDFFKDHCVFNYCPLGFLDGGKSAKNITPDKLEKSQRLALENLCDNYLSRIITLIGPKYLIGVGKYAETKLLKVSSSLEGDFIVSSIIHPSPGNPQANNGWKEKTTAKLVQLGVWEE